MGQKPSTSSKFKVSNKPPTKIRPTPSDKKGINMFIGTKPYETNHCTEILQGTKFPNQARLESNGFVKTVVECYNQHVNLTIRPDDVWTAIMVQFSFYINKEAEKFRKKFVNFEGKKTLVVTVPGTLRGVSYAGLVNLMTQEIDANLVDAEVKDWVIPSFSTTTQDDKVVCGVILMATMKKYFDYVFQLICGIPYVTLEGTVEDWEEIARRLEKLKEYELEWWHDMLKPIVQEFIKGRRGQPNIDFWGRICSVENMGSGPSYLSGWITTFCVFDEDGNRQGYRKESDPWVTIKDTQIPIGSVEVNVRINDNGTDYNSVLFGGHLGTELMKDGYTLKPFMGWVICLTPITPEEKAMLDERKDVELAFIPTQVGREAIEAIEEE